MKPHRIFPAVALAMLWGGHAFASGPAYSYVTTGPGKQVLKIDNSTGAVTSLFTASAGSVTSLSDLTLFSDGKLYVGAIGGNINIIRVDRNGNGFDQLGSANNPKELRFSAYQMLFCNGDGGVRRTDSPTGSCSTPIAGATASPGTGLAFTANGSLLALVNGQLKKVRLDANGQSTGSTVIPIDVSGVKSLGVAAGGDNTATHFDPDDILIATATEIRLLERVKTPTPGYAASSVSLVSTDGPALSGRTINYMELDAEDRIWFTTMRVNGSSNDPNGELWVYQGGVPVFVAAAPKQNGKYWPLVGLAVDPSDRTISISSTHPLANFGTSLFEIGGTINEDCTVSVRATTKFADVPAIGSNFTLNPYLGDEGFQTVYDATVNPPTCDVFPENDGRVMISALGASHTNLRMLKCEASCTPVTLLAAFRTGPLDDDDETDGGTDSFSKWLVVNENLPSAGYVYCGIQTPLKDGGDADHPQSTVNTGSNLTVKFQLGRSDCKQNHVVSDPNAQFLVSVARVRPDYEAKHIPDSSGSSNQPPLFRFSSSGSQFIYNLSLKNLDGTNFEPGTYEITITDVNSPPYIPGPPPIYLSVVGK
jgi:hypothetical protein